MSMHEPNTPRWWKEFFRYDPGIQLEFVHEAIAKECGEDARWADEFWADAHSSWHEANRVHVFDGELTVAQLALLLAGHEFTIAHEIPLIIEQFDVIERQSPTPLALPRYTAARWKEQLAAADVLLRSRFAWIVGWRANRIKHRAETSLEYDAQRSNPASN